MLSFPTALIHINTWIHINTCPSKNGYTVNHNISKKMGGARVSIFLKNVERIRSEGTLDNYKITLLKTQLVTWLASKAIVTTGECPHLKNLCSLGVEI